MRGATTAVRRPTYGRLVRLLLAAALLVPLLTALHARADVGEPVCVPTPRPPSSPVFDQQENRFGFHDEELVLCSPGYQHPTHLAARLFVPKACPDAGGCPGVLAVHGFGFSKETTVSDMQNLANRGFYVLTYDVRGQGASGGQAEMMTREEIADEAAVLQWWHENVRPTKTAIYGISQGGSHALMGAIYNCGAARAAQFDSTVPCDQGGRWVDAIIPVQPPTMLTPNYGTCDMFWLQATPETRMSDGVTGDTARCNTRGLLPGQVSDELGSIDRDTNNYIKRADRVDVPAYVITSFYDRLVPAADVVWMWRLLRARSNASGNPMSGNDVRLTMSNDAHGAVGGNFAVLDDAFNWLEWQFGMRGPLRTPPVATAQAWAGNAFRLENDWPVPGTATRSWYLSRKPTDAAANGALLDSAPSWPQAGDTMANVPVAPSGASSTPYADTVKVSAGTSGIPYADLRYLTAPMAQTVEVSGLPSVAFWVKSTNANQRGEGQLHVALYAVAANGKVTEFARTHRGFRGLGPTPVRVTFPLTVSSYRLPKGSRLMVQVTPSDVGESVLARGVDRTTIVHDPQHPSVIHVPLAPVDRVQPAGPVPSGPAFPGDAVSAICKGLGLPCS